MTDHSKYQQRATKDDIIDLTSDSNDDVIVSNGNMRSVDIHFNNNPFADDDDDEFDDGVSMMHQLGSVTCTIVGIKYYKGVAHPGEYVKLIREPDNPYDRNAIRVDNIRNEKVGHIKATTAMTLAKVMDQFLPPTRTTNTSTTSTIYMDGTIALRGATSYSLPLQLDFYSQSKSDYMSDLVQINNALTKLYGWKPDKALMTLLRSSSLKSDDVDESNFSDVEVTNQKLNWEDAQQNLDVMFDQLVNTQLSNLPPIPIPATIVTPLLDHQIDGIRWLHHHEICMNEQKRDQTSKASALSIPFYKQIQERGKKVWLSEITNATQIDPPKPIGGSILADDMGLGKSLQALGLILTNAPASTSEPRTTLIICPVSVMSNWVMQVEQHLLPNTLKVGLYHGSDRFNLLSTLPDLDILVTSYGTISTDFANHSPKGGTGKKQDKKENQPPKKKKAKLVSSIFEKQFRRIILDEAHTIRNVQSKTYAGCMALQATYRLCLTGTPLQNKPEDIHSLLSFLSVEPLGDRSIFRRAIAQPIYVGDAIGLSRLRTVMAHVALRRNKSKLDLVPKTVELRSVAFPDDCAHRRIHDVLFESAQLVFRATLSSGNDNQVSKNYMKILETLMRIRQACISGALVPKASIQAAEDVMNLVKGKGALSAEDGEKLLQKLKGAFDEATTTECAICFDTMEVSDAVILRTCSHVFCELCLATVSERCNGLCPMCRCKFEASDMIKSSVAIAATLKTTNEASMIETMNDLGPSPKLKALALAIGEMKVDEKGVIFSQFTKLLDVLEPFLQSMGHTFVRIDGSKTATQRINAMREFNVEIDGPRFILCSLHAAGTGITLTRGNHCFMMDTWWNSSVEQQAMDRIHRIGQKRNVRVIRFIMKDSIEERMIQLQEAKAAVGKGSMEKLKPDEVRKARIGDLKSLFSIKDSV